MPAFPLSPMLILGSTFPCSEVSLVAVLHFNVACVSFNRVELRLLDKSLKSRTLQSASFPSHLCWQRLDEPLPQTQSEHLLKVL
jgi:hypothetical protein